MTGPEMATITSSLERSLQNFSLTSNGGVSSSPENNLSLPSGDDLDLNSHISLPYHWEQCLDLKTGEVYYKNWKTGMLAKEDPRTTGDFFSEGDEDEDDDNDYSSYEDSEDSSAESSPISFSRDNQIYQLDHHNNNNFNKSGDDNNKRESVLVVAGCKSCLMYFMVPKQDSICPKCCGQLLHFDQSENGSV